MNFDLFFLKKNFCDNLHEIVNDVVNFLQIFARFHDYVIFITRNKSHNSRRLEISIDVFYFQCSKNDKIIFFKIIKRKRDKFKIIECFFNMIVRENWNVWILKMRCKNHNHDSIQIHTHSFHKKLIMTTKKKSHQIYFSKWNQITSITQ